MLLARLEEVLSLEGDIAECGVSEGGTVALMLFMCKEHNSPKIVHMFDVFGKFPDLRTEQELMENKNKRHDIKHMTPHSVEEVTTKLHNIGLTNFEIHKGLFSETLPLFNKPLCLIHADADLYQPMKEACQFANRLLVKNGYLIIHDYKDRKWSGPEKAVNEIINPNEYETVQYLEQLILRKK